MEQNRCKIQFSFQIMFLLRNTVVIIIMYKRVECKLSGPGAEYGGTKEIATSASKCRSWHKRYEPEDSKVNKINLNAIFSEQNLKKFFLFFFNDVTLSYRVKSSEIRTFLIDHVGRQKISAEIRQVTSEGHGVTSKKVSNIFESSIAMFHFATIEVLHDFVFILWILIYMIFFVLLLFRYYVSQIAQHLRRIRLIMLYSQNYTHPVATLRFGLNCGIQVTRKRYTHLFIYFQRSIITMYMYIIKTLYAVICSFRRKNRT